MQIQAGIGLKSVHGLFIGLSDRQASHLLHSISGFIYTEPFEILRIEKIKGYIEVSDTPYMHPSDPRREDYEKEGVVGGTLLCEVKVDLKELEDDMGVSLVMNDLNSRLVSSLIQSINKNIYFNIIKAQPLINLEDILDPISKLISAPRGYEVKDYSLDEETVLFQVDSMKKKDSNLIFNLRISGEYLVYAENVGRRLRYLEEI